MTKEMIILIFARLGLAFFAVLSALVVMGLMWY